MQITVSKVKEVQWSSERAFVLATAAAAVGLGNIWRFPYLAGENGGAAFIIAYIIAVLAVGIPLMIVEISAGRVKRGSPVKTFRGIHKGAAPFGWFVVGLTMLIMSYYLVVTGWTLGYALESLTGSIRPFPEFINSYASLWYFGIVAVITGLIVARGVKIIELLSRVMMPLLLLVILFITGYSLTLPGTPAALSFLFTPDFSSFLSPSLWVLAFGQAFYSLAVGQGYLVTYGSFLPNSINIPRAVGIVAIFETSIALVAGLMIFPFVFTFGLNPGQGSELAFTTLPIAFANIPYGSLFAIGFFWLFFLAAISSCVAGMQVIKTAMREEMKLTHKWATVASFLPILPLGVLAALSFTPAKLTVLGRPVLEVLDMFAANQVVIALGLIGGAIISRNIPTNLILNTFGNKWRRYASHTVFVAKYLWLIVLLLLLVSFALSPAAPAVSH